MSNSGSGASLRQVSLNVGGVRYVTTRTTLTKYPDSMLGRMFGGDIPTAQDEDGAYFIDRNGILFSEVLDFLRTDTLKVPKRQADLEALKREADFYQIVPMMNALGEHSDPIYLNVGGFSYTTTIETIKRYPDSLLCCMLEGSVDVVFDENGAFVIDRDGAVFRHIINFMRNEKLILPENFDEFELLKEEAEFYQVGPLMEALPKVWIFHDIEIVDRTDLQFIMVKAPDFILNHPKFPYRVPQSLSFGNSRPKCESEREEMVYHQSGYYRITTSRGAFSDFLRSIGCRLHQSSTSMTWIPENQVENYNDGFSFQHRQVNGSTFTKTIERWTVCPVVI